MNDFTKRELEWIYEGMQDLIGADSLEPERILMKIKSMIDDYCEHDGTVSSSEVDYVFHCSKCGEFKGWS